MRLLIFPAPPVRPFCSRLLQIEVPMGMVRNWVAICAACCAWPTPAQVNTTAPEAVSLLRANCSPCHSLQNRSSGLSVDSRAEILQGGNRGPAIKVGASADSLLVQAIEQKGELKMPPGRRLSDAQIAVIRAWIEQGMNWPDDKP